MLLDFLTEDIIGEVHFNDSTAHHRLCIRIAEKAMYVPENGCVMLVNNHIDCIKRLIAQCYLNPYDTKWMHHDIELVTSQGDGIMLLVCIDEVDR